MVMTVMIFTRSPLLSSICTSRIRLSRRALHSSLYFFSASSWPDSSSSSAASTSSVQITCEVTRAICAGTLKTHSSRGLLMSSQASASVIDTARTPFSVICMFFTRSFNQLSTAPFISKIHGKATVSLSLDTIALAPSIAPGFDSGSSLITFACAAV
jgi:hypothetical protein